MGAVDPAVRFGTNVRYRRRALDLTQMECAERSGIAQSTWSKIETGQVDPGVRVVARVAQALDTTPAELLAGVE